MSNPTEAQLLAFQQFLDQELATIRAQVRDSLPDYPWAFGFAFGPGIPVWDEAVNPA